MSPRLSLSSPAEKVNHTFVQILSGSCLSISNLRRSLSRSRPSRTFTPVRPAWVGCCGKETEVRSVPSCHCHPSSVDRLLLGLGSSKSWEDILEDFAGVRTFSVQACLRYFQPLRDYLEELVAQGQLNVGWTCPSAKSSSPSTRHLSWLLLSILLLLLRL